MHPTPTPRGAATLGITLLLLVTMMLVAGIANRNLIFEQRASANQWRSTQAFEAAEAGLEWAQAMLASDAAIGADCAPDAAPGNEDLRERMLAYDADSRRFAARTWVDAGQVLPLQAACVRGADGWTCSCPRDGRPLLDAPADTGAQPVFAVHFAAAAREGQLQLIATGCDRLSEACLAGAATAGTASARVQVTLALLPALAAAPAAALTARGAIDASGALTLANTDPLTSGLTAHAGGGVVLPQAVLQTHPGAPIDASLAAHDAALAGLTAERVASRLFGLDATRWAQLPGLHAITCAADCGAQIGAALEAGQRRIRITNDLQTAGPIVIGSPQRPALLVVDGGLQLADGARIHGAVVTLAPAWDTSGNHDVRIQGALIAAGDVVGSGTPAIEYDRAVLDRLHHEAGVFVRVPGSWRDF